MKRIQQMTNRKSGSRKNLFRLLTAHRSLLIALVLLTAHCSLLTNAAHAQQVVDKMVATVNASGQTRCQVCLITYSDLLWQLALQPDTVLANPSSDELNRTLNLIIDQRLILQEAEKLPSIAPTSDEITAARDELVKAFPSQAEFQARLQRVGLTAEKLNEIIDQRVKIEKYLDFRFRNFVVITQTEIRKNPDRSKDRNRHRRFSRQRPRTRRDRDAESRIEFFFAHPGSVSTRQISDSTVVFCSRSRRVSSLQENRNLPAISSGPTSRISQPR